MACKRDAQRRPTSSPDQKAEMFSYLLENPALIVGKEAGSGIGLAQVRPVQPLVDAAWCGIRALGGRWAQPSASMMTLPRPRS